MIIKTLKKLYHSFIDLLFIINNLAKTLVLPKIETIIYKNYTFRAIKKSEIKQLSLLYKSIFSNNTILLRNKLLWIITASKLVLIVEDNTTKKIIGFVCLYFNQIDFQENSIHLAQIGINNFYQGLGLSKEMHKFLINHFQKTDLDAISIRISLNNTPSLNSALHCGYKPIEKYYDNSLNEYRFYLKRKLN